mmetsp:Transcript_46220/g.46900  ORF Transcript_46220/g.46900 Transcript_46220/m.46900 type:complete len:269 (-) Transcript_46220:151-957(-)
MSRSSTMRRSVYRQDLAGLQNNYIIYDDDGIDNNNDEDHDDENNHDHDEYDSMNQIPLTNTSSSNNNNKITTIISSIIRRPMKYIYNTMVVFVVDLITIVLSQPKLQDLICEIIVRAINAFMDQDDIGTKMDDTARRIIYDSEKAKQSARAIGKEVVPMVTGFVGGVAQSVATSLTPSIIAKKRNNSKHQQQQQQQQKAANKKKEYNINNNDNSKRIHTHFGNSASTMSTNYELDELDEEGEVEVELEENDATDKNENGFLKSFKKFK